MDCVDLKLTINSEQNINLYIAVSILIKEFLLSCLLPLASCLLPLACSLFPVPYSLCYISFTKAIKLI
ncbi:MAG: hypothetical protein F6J90_12860 [Moorea sp. SIOASIH]|uniref:hypothetical protein n=1 Tax=Moorena sp. SIOASIH TaxID=2607817 RepID=UPI0013B90BD5|nr:hypothetical protein [Moorena sp. SIOASIH]NEO37157.1 hypothetical protein [Moorena sp. SIOASIH]